MEKHYFFLLQEVVDDAFKKRIEGYDEIKK